MEWTKRVVLLVNYTPHLSYQWDDWGTKTFFYSKRFIRFVTRDV